MLALQAGVLAAAQEGDKTSLLDILPWWWARLIVGIVLLAISGGIVLLEKRKPDATKGLWFLDWIKFFFGLGGLVLILQSVGVI